MYAISINELRRFAVETLVASGFGAEDAETTARVLVTTDLFGVTSHGTKNLLQYIQKAEAGGIDKAARPSVESEGPAWAIVNGNAAIGMVSACFGMELAIKKAADAGIGYVGVKNSCHFGAAGYYANLAAERGMLGIAMSNGDPIMSVPGACVAAIGNNPFSFAAPYGGKSVFLDIALSGVAALKVVMAKEKGVTVPKEWLIDKNGEPTDDPSGFPFDSCLQPMAAHKGYGLAVMVELLAALLTGAGMLGEVVSWNRELGAKNNVGHAFIAVDIAKLLPPELYAARMETLVGSLKSTPKAKGAEQIFLPGEMEWSRREAAEKAGRISLTDVMADNFVRLSEQTGIPLELIKE